MDIKFVSTMKNSEHISFICEQQLIEPILSIIPCLQAKFAEVYFGLKKIQGIIHIYKETCKMVLKLINKFGTEEK